MLLMAACARSDAIFPRILDASSAKGELLHFRCFIHAPFNFKGGIGLYRIFAAYLEMLIGFFIQVFQGVCTVLKKFLGDF